MELSIIVGGAVANVLVVVTGFFWLRRNARKSRVARQARVRAMHQNAVKEFDELVANLYGDPPKPVI